MEITTIAELAKNHCGNVNDAKTLISKAKEAGFTAVKMQAYDIDKMNLSHPNYLRYAASHLDIPTLEMLSKYAMDIGLDFHLSVFNKNLFEKVATFCNIVKIPSTYADNQPFIDEALEHFSPEDIHVSHGMNSDPIYGFTNYYCCSAYPVRKTNLRNLIGESFQGYSDHMQGDEACLYAALMGVKYIEKHFQYDHKLAQSWEFNIHTATMFHGKLQMMLSKYADPNEERMDRVKAFFKDEFPGEFA